MEEIAPISVVRGNNDKEWAEYIPETLFLEEGALHIFMVHNKKHIPKILPRMDLIIYGHSHKYEDKEVDGIHYQNPGSCGPRRFHQEITLAIMTIQDNGSYQIEKISIEHAEKKKADDKAPADIGELMPVLMKDIATGKTVSQIARKHRISEDLTDQIMRMYLMHPGVDADGMLRRMGL